jgi:hypothetical protein
MTHNDDLILGPVAADPIPPTLDSMVPPPVPLTQNDRRDLLLRFNLEGRLQRRLFRAASLKEWETVIAPTFDQENQPSKDSLDV